MNIAHLVTLNVLDLLVELRDALLPLSGVLDGLLPNLVEIFNSAFHLGKLILVRTRFADNFLLSNDLCNYII